MLVSPYIPNGPKVIVAAGATAASTAFGGILSLSLFYFYRNRSSKLRGEVLEYFNT